MPSMRSVLPKYPSLFIFSKVPSSVGARGSHARNRPGAPGRLESRGGRAQLPPPPALIVLPKLMTELARLVPETRSRLRPETLVLSCMCSRSLRDAFWRMPSRAALARSSAPASNASLGALKAFSIMLEMLLWLPRLPLRRLPVDVALSTEMRRPGFLPTMDWNRSSSNGDFGGDASFGGDRRAGEP